MAAPTVSVTAQRLYDRLPDVYRKLDEQNNWAFLLWIDGVVNSLDDVDTLRNQFMYLPGDERDAFVSWETPHNDYGATYDTSTLLDGEQAASEWLPWLMLLVGADVTRLYTDDERRNAIVNPFAGYQAGSRESLRQAVLELLTGTKYLAVYDHTKVVGASMQAGTEWEVTIVTKAGETPAGDLVATIIRKGAKPAGIMLYTLPYSISWASFQTTFPNWAAIEAAGNWQTLEAAGS